MHVTNIMIAVSTGAFAILGALSSYISVPVLVGNALLFGALIVIGKYGNEQLEDMPKVCQMEGDCD
ncbi:hypothetical protein NoPa_00029 [Pseudomonas phage vB_PpuM-NoPa]|uniref:Holin n=4 Tax=Tartuvirus TaxID=3424912 RepID=A0AAX4MWQ7_9CAUD